MTTVFELTSLHPSTSTAVATDVLLSVLDDAIDLCAQHEDDDLHTGTAAGRALADLAALARVMVHCLGGDGGTPLVEGHGVVVVREIVTATRLLRRTLDAADPATPVGADGLVASAKGLHARLREAMTAQR
jgi:hypothetical protein